MALVLGACLFTSTGGARADLVYTPTNPSFGGNPLNSAHLFGLANAQRTATASDARSSLSPGLGGPGSPLTPSSADLFISQLQGRLLSALASQVTEAIFGSNPMDAGTITFGDTTVTFFQDAFSIRLEIFDGTALTVIEVPKLVSVTP